jgi:hypothetical protein
MFVRCRLFLCHLGMSSGLCSRRGNGSSSGLTHSNKNMGIDSNRFSRLKFNSISNRLRPQRRSTGSTSRTVVQIPKNHNYHARRAASWRHTGAIQNGGRLHLVLEAEPQIVTVLSYFEVRNFSDEAAIALYYTHPSSHL